MNRKIRAWSNKFDKMIYHDDDEIRINVHGDGSIILWKDLVDDEGAVRMDSSGEQDEDGKEVYKGDIMQCQLFDGELNGEAVVKFADGSFYLDYEHCEDNFPQDFADRFYKFKVVGNIHEHEIEGYEHSTD